MNSVAIIGAGITGLTAAFYLKRKGVPVTVYEASGRVGGVIQSIRQDGYLAEFGPNTLLETSPKITQLIQDAGLASRRLNPDPRAEARYVVRYKRPIEMPAKPLGFFTTELFSLGAKLAVVREPFVKPRREGPEESIAQFVVRRFNQEFLDHAIDALVAGIYAGDPYKLSLPHAFPKLKALEDNYGSMIKGQIFGARERKKRGEVAKDRAPKFSFDEGLQVLPETLCASLGDSMKLNTSVTKLTRTDEGWRLTIKSPEGRVTRVPDPSAKDGDSQSSSLRETEADHSAVIFCGTAPSLAKLEIINGRDGALRRPDRSSQRDDPTNIDFSAFSGIRYPPVTSVVLGFRREDVAHPCEGFGMLIPRIEGFKILGTIFSSSLFPNRAPAGHLTLTSYVGGERYPDLASLPADQLYETTCADLRVLLGVKGKPTFRHHVYYPHAIPQYNVGYGRYRDLMTEIESKAPGLFLAGHYRDGISLSDCIVSGCKVTERVEKHLASSQAVAK